MHISGMIKHLMGHVNLTMPLLRVIVVLMLGLDVAYKPAKFDHSSFSCSGDS